MLLILLISKLWICTLAVQMKSQNQIVAQFTKPSQLQIVIATVAFGMGIHCPDVHKIIHLGPP